MDANRAVLHFDLDTFFVSCVRLQNSLLNGKPVIIGGSQGRGVVASCSYETRQYGVSSAMPMKFALQLCPDAIVVKGDMDFFSRKSKEVSEIIGETAPLVEKASIDEFYIDATGLDRFFGTYKWSTELAARIQKEAGLPISFGLSTNKTVAKIATGEGKPEGRLQVALPKVKPFLNPLSIRKIPMVGRQTYQLLSRIGVRKIHTLSETPPEMLRALIGENGPALWRKANGIDHSPVVSGHERKSMSSERTFDKDTMDLTSLRHLLVGMTEKLAYQLRHEKKLTSVVEVKIRYVNFDTETKQKRIAYTGNDHTLIAMVLDLFEKLYHRRMRLRLVGIKFSGLVGGSHQIDLFDDRPEIIRLYQAMDSVRDRFGKHAVMRAANIKNPVLARA